MNDWTVDQKMDLEQLPVALGFLLCASEKASARGDYLQAEKLLKTSLKQAEQQLLALENAIAKMIEDLSEIYEMQGKTEDVDLLKERLEQLSIQEREHYFSLLKNKRQSA